MDYGFNAEYRFGSAAWADETALCSAGLFGSDGVQIAYFENNALRIDGDAPLITVGGAGSGKLRDQIGAVICNTPGQPMLALDPRAELSAVSFQAHAQHGEYAYHWNPVALCGMPQWSCNPLDILDASSISFTSDCQFIAEGLIAAKSQGDGKYFELRARDWVACLLKSRVERFGQTSFPDLWRTINIIETDNKAWADELEAMLESRYDDVRRTAGEMLAKQQDSEREFGGIMGEIYAYLGFLADPALRASLERSDFSLEALCDPGRAHKIFLIVPSEYLGLWAPILRVFFTVTMLYKTRRPDARRVMLLVDEAGQLGSFDALLRAYTFGRGAGIRTWAFFQDAGQIIRNFGPTGLQGFFGSAQTRMVFGVRDIQTARLVSDMLGNETLNYQDEQQRNQAKRAKWNAAQQMMTGGDPFGAAYDYAYYAKAEETDQKQSRPLMTPDEIMAMPEDRLIAFVSGKNVKPIYGWKHPYFQRRETAGLYMANPYHPPLDRVPIATRWGVKMRSIHTCDPIPPFAQYPQYRSHPMAWVDGFKWF